MALDVFHQVLVKLFEAAGGNPRQMVSLVDIVKRERLTAHLESISNRLQDQGFIADAPRRDHVFITTWGIEEVNRVTRPAEAPKAPASSPPPPEPPAPPAPKAEAPPPPPPPEAKNAAEVRRAAEKARELADVLDGLVAPGGTAAQRRAKARKALAAATAAVEKAFE